MRYISPGSHNISLANVSGIKAEVFGHRSAICLSHDLGVEKSADFLAVMHVGSGHDDRQRDATRVDEDVSLGSIFFPCPWGWAQRIPAQAELRG